MGGKLTGDVRHERGVAIAVAGMFMGKFPAETRWEYAGSIRRGRDDVGDIDLVIERTDAVQVKLAECFGLQKNGKPCRSGVVDGIQIDCNLAAPDEWGAFLMFATGSAETNIAMRRIAIKRGWKLNQYGLFDGSGKKIAGTTEQEVYAALECDWVPPERR